MQDTGSCKSWSRGRPRMACFLLIANSYKSESINSARLNNIFSHDLLKLNGTQSCSFAMLFHRAPSQTCWRKPTLRWKAFGKRTAHSEHITSTLRQERLSLIFKAKLISDWACVLQVMLQWQQSWLLHCSRWNRLTFSHVPPTYSSPCPDTLLLLPSNPLTTLQAMHPSHSAPVSCLWLTGWWSQTTFSVSHWVYGGLLLKQWSR